MLMAANRRFVDVDLWREAAATGADLLWRVKNSAVLPLQEELADGSYLSRTYAARDKRAHADPEVVRVTGWKTSGSTSSRSARRNDLVVLLDQRGERVTRARLVDESSWPDGTGRLRTPARYASAMAGRTYAENRPYLLPDTLGELDGPVTGVVQLPLRLDWSDRMVFHLEEPAERNLMYERVIREAMRADDLRMYLNESVLRQVWTLLFLPRGVRQSWEQRFPDLRLAA